MYISLKWLKNFVNLKNIPLSSICNKLTLAGFEIEDIVEKKILAGFDIILDVTLTANRPDLFNLNELSKEINTILQLPEYKFFNKKKLLNKINKQSTFLFFSNYSYQRFIQEKFFYSQNNIKKSNESFDGCSLFFTFEHDNIKVKESPQWIQKALIASNFTPINNIIDTLNFLLLETGYPFVVYDLSKLKQLTNNSKLNFKTRLSNSHEYFPFIKNKNTFLNKENLLVLANENVISIAGLVELPELSVTQTTTEILIQGTLFDPIQIRKSSQTLGLRTEISTRFEKRLNINSLEKAIIRLYHLFSVQKIFFNDLFQLNIKHIDCIKNLNEIKQSSEILLNYENINSTLGVGIGFKLIQKDDILTILKKLYFQVEEIDDKFCKVSVPFARNSDITREIDLIEEIGRIVGFNYFFAQRPINLKLGKLSTLEKIKRKLRFSLLTFGFYEVLHPTLVPYVEEKQINLKNPLLTENSSLRSTLLKTLVEKVAFNYKQGNQFLQSFEIGRVYRKELNGSFIEEEVISGIFGSQPYKNDWIKKELQIEWLEAKGLIEDLFQEFHLKPKWQKSTNKDNSIFHPGRIAELFVSNKKIGCFGEIHPNQSKIYGFTQRSFLFEFDLQKIETFWIPKQFFSYSRYSSFPNSVFDLSCLVPKNIVFEEVETKIKETAQPLLKSLELFDYYSGEEIPVGYYSLGFKLKFQEYNRTLKNSEIDFIINQIMIELQSNLQIIFRNKI